MTSFAFILGVWPLVNSRGAGAASRQALGTAVFGGMIASTLLAVFVVPVFFTVFQWISELRYGAPKPIGNTVPDFGDEIPVDFDGQADAHGAKAGESSQV